MKICNGTVEEFERYRGVKGRMDVVRGQKASSPEEPKRGSVAIKHKPCSKFDVDLEERGIRIREQAKKAPYPNSPLA